MSVGEKLALLVEAGECTQPDPQNPGKTLCGFTFAGDFGSYFRLPGATACSAFSANGYYVTCADHAIYD